MTVAAAAAVIGARATMASCSNRIARAAGSALTSANSAANVPTTGMFGEFGEFGADGGGEKGGEYETSGIDLGGKLAESAEGGGGESETTRGGGRRTPSAAQNPELGGLLGGSPGLFDMLGSKGVALRSHRFNAAT